MCNSNLASLLVFCILCLLLLWAFYAMYAMCKQSSIENKFRNHYETAQKIALFLSVSENLANDNKCILYINSVCRQENWSVKPPTIFNTISLIEEVRKIPLDEENRTHKIEKLASSYI